MWLSKFLDKIFDKITKEPINMNSFEEVRNFIQPGRKPK